MYIRDDHSWPRSEPRGDQDEGPRGMALPPGGRRRAGDALEPPDGLGLRDVRRSLDHEDLRRAAPDLPAERLRHVARVRQELREGTYATDARLWLAIERAIDDLDRSHENES